MRTSITFPLGRYAVLILAVLLLSGNSEVLAQDAPQKDQGNIILHGEVRDKVTGGQLVGAALRVFNSSDSLVGKGKAEGRQWSSYENALLKTSSFGVQIPHVKDIYTIEVSYENYDTLYQTVNLHDMGRREFSREIGIIPLTRVRHEQLKEVTVTASKVKFYNRGDTIVYNADAFQLADGSMLDALVKQLPGVELKDGGQIYVNGDYVEELLLNGRDFFKGDNQVMLDNLGAYAVQNIEVYKKTDEMDEFIGKNSQGSKRLVMDVKIKKEYIGGWNFNLEAGGGTQERYLGRLFGMHFTANNQFTLYANVNNLNDSRSPNGDNEWNPAYRPKGTKEFREAGFNYSMEQTHTKAKQEGNLIVRSMQSRYNDGVNTTNFLPLGNNYQYSSSSRRQHDFYIHSDHNLRKEFTSVKVIVRPSFEYRYGKSWSLNESSTLNAETLRDTALVYGRGLIGGSLQQDKRQKMINASLSDAYNGDYHLNMGVKAITYVKIPRTSDAIGFAGEYQFKNHHSNDRSDYRIAYGDPSITPTSRSQQKKVSPNHVNRAAGSVLYSLQFSEETSLDLNYDLEFQRQKKNSAFYLGQLQAQTTGDYTVEALTQTALDFDPSNSFTSIEDRLQHSVSMTFSSETEKFFFYLNPSLEIYDYILDYNQAGQHSKPGFNKALAKAFAMVQYHSEDGTTNAQLILQVSPSTPSLIDMITPVNTTDPLNVYLGNPDLKGYYSYRPSFNFSKRKSGVYSIFLQGNMRFLPNSIVKGYVYDNTTGIRYHKSYNVKGNMSATVEGGYSLRFFKRFNLNYLGSYTYARNYDMIGENDHAPQKSRMNLQTMNHELELIYEPSSNFKVDIDYNPQWQWARNQRGTSFNIREDKLGLHFNAKLPYNWGIKTGMDMFGRHGYGDKDMDTTDWIWNARVTKSFRKGTWLLALDAYDLLHQMRAVTYSISPQCRIEKFTNTIPRYILFHVQYRLNIMPKKDSVKKKEKVTWR